MSSKYKPHDCITNQLDEQNFNYELLTKDEIIEVENHWKSKFIGNKTAPHLEYYLWHIFSFNKDYGIEGELAFEEYKKQYPTEIIIFNERQEYGIRIPNQGKIPVITMKDFTDDIYISQKNMKWTYVISHEIPSFGPYFSY